MVKFKKLCAGILSAAMMLSLVACSTGGTGDATPTPAASNATPTPTAAASSTEKRTSDIYIGTWWTQHYDSADTALEDSADYVAAIDSDSDTDEQKAENAVNRAAAEAKFNKLKTVESTYGLKIYWENLTYAGVQESINTSIIGGAPDCDIYLVDAGMAIPAQMNNLCIDLKTILPEDHDLFTDQTVVSYLDLGDGRACILQKMGGMSNNGALGFNKQLLEENNLEDPRVLWEKGEWTWDKFMEYCKVLTQDTDGDGQIDQYGYGGYYPDLLEKLMLSNGADIAATTTQHLTSEAMTETLEFIQEMYVDEKIALPANYEDDANSCRTAYRNGNIGFFYIDVWIEESNGSDYNYNNGNATDDDPEGKPLLNFDTIYCHWPVGPSGDQESDAQMNSVGSAELYIIPAGVEDPLTVFNAIYDMWNWFDNDVTVRDNPALNNWWLKATSTDATIQQENYDVQVEILSHKTLDLWNSMGASFDLWSLIGANEEKEVTTVSQWQETYKQVFQDALDTYFGN